MLGEAIWALSFASKRSFCSFRIASIFSSYAMMDSACLDRGEGADEIWVDGWEVASVRC